MTRSMAPRYMSGSVHVAALQVASGARSGARTQKRAQIARSPAIALSMRL